MLSSFPLDCTGARGFLFAAAFCWMTFLHTNTYAQETRSEILDRLEEHRSDLRSYVAKLTIVSYSTDDFGPPVGIYRSFSIREIGVAADKTQDSVLSCSTSYSAESSPPIPSQVILRRGDEFWMTAGPRFSSAPRSRADNLIEPDIIGLAFCAEIRRFATFKELLSNYRSWGNTTATKSPENDDLAVFQNVTFDTQRGYSPVRTGVPDRVLVRCEPILTDEGLWLPRQAFYECNGDYGMYIHVDWIAVNRPISPLLLQPETVAKLSGYEFEGTAAPDTAAPAGVLSESVTQKKKAQESLRESWATLGTSYRDVFQQTWLSSESKAIGITSEQLEAAHDFLNNNRTNLPDFELLAQDADSVSAFFSSLAQRLTEANEKYEKAFQKILKQEQIDALIGLYIARNGLEAFTNYAVQKRLSMSEQQVEALKKQIQDRHAIARGIWVDTSEYSEGDPDLSGLDFRASATLTGTREFLDKRQLSLIAGLLEYVPKSTQQRLTFGF